MRSSLWCWCVCAVALGLAGCTGQTESCDSVSFPAPPSDAAEPIFVAQPCEESIADGSRERPYANLTDAITKAAAGATILVASDTEYAEDLVIDKPMRLLASPPDAAAQDASVTIRPTIGPGVRLVSGAHDVVIRGLKIERGKGAGVWVQDGASGAIESTLVQNTEPDGDGNYGYGILSSAGGDATIRLTDVTSPRDAGIYVMGGHATITDVTVTDSVEHGAIRIEDAQGDVAIKDVNINDCAEVGILVSNSKATISNATILNITTTTDGIGDGIIVRRRKDKSGAYTAGAEANIDGSLISKVDRVGVLFSEGATGSLTGSQIITNGLHSSWTAGVWIQSGAGGDMGVLVSNNTIRENRFNGIGVTSGAVARILNNMDIVSTKADYTQWGDSTLQLGQGIAVYGKARVRIESNRIVSNDNSGVLMDDPGAGTTITDNEIQFNTAFGLVIQHATEGIPPFSKNTFDMNAFGPTQILGEAEPGFPIHDIDFNTP